LKIFGGGGGYLAIHWGKGKRGWDIKSSKGQFLLLAGLHRKKKVREFPVPSRDVTTKLSLGGNNDVISELFLPRGSLVSDIPAGDGKLVNLFLRCTDWEKVNRKVQFFDSRQYAGSKYLVANATLFRYLFHI
jgi:hypothetical protein